jgi:hypothetical protein
MDYGRFVSRRSAQRKPSAIRSLLKYMSVPGMVGLFTTGVDIHLLTGH